MRSHVRSRRQFYHRHAVAALAGRGGGVGADEGVVRQHLADGAAGGGGALAVGGAQLGEAAAERLVQPLLDEEERLVGRHAAHVELGRDARRGAGGAANGGADVRLAFALLHALDLAEGDAGAEGAELDLDLALIVRWGEGLAGEGEVAQEEEVAGLNGREGAAAALSLSLQLLDVLLDGLDLLLGGLAGGGALRHWQAGGALQLAQGLVEARPRLGELVAHLAARLLQEALAAGLEGGEGRGGLA